MLNDRSTPLQLLRTRRSGRPRDMVEPGPGRDELAEMIAVAARTPDHGKLTPWRFVTVPRERRDDFARLLRSAFSAERGRVDERKLEGAEASARQAPALVVVLSAPVRGHKIPLWEQEASAGAAVMNLLHAAHAMGYAASWITGWVAESEQVRRAFGGEGERIVGLVYIGTPGLPLEERERPEPARISREWTGLAT